MSNSPNSGRDDPSSAVVPFGKHKGATVAELVATDPDYVRWLMAQGWMAQRFAELHAAIATRGAVSDDSPEHNALQARFLDHGFRLAFLNSAVGHHVAAGLTAIKKDLVAARRWKRDEVSSYLAATRLRELDFSPSWNMELDERWREQKKADIKAREEELVVAETRLTSAINANWRTETNALFEQNGVDVVISWAFRLDTEHDNSRGSLGSSVGVELKPSFGDDYPTIMRQMQRLQTKYLVANSYNGTTVSEQQLRDMFLANKFKLVLVHEIEAEQHRTVLERSLPAPDWRKPYQEDD